MAKPNAEEQARQTEHEVTLLSAHTHDGVQYKSGDKIRVNSVELDWLKAQKVVA